MISDFDLLERIAEQDASQTWEAIRERMVLHGHPAMVCRSCGHTDGVHDFMYITQIATFRWSCHVSDEDDRCHCQGMGKRDAVLRLFGARADA